MTTPEGKQTPDEQPDAHGTEVVPGVVPEDPVATTAGAGVATASAGRIRTGNPSRPSDSGGSDAHPPAPAVAERGEDAAVDAGADTPATIAPETGPEPAVDTATAVPAPADPDDPEDPEDDGERPLDDEELCSALEAMLLVVDAPAPTELLAAAVADSPTRVDRVLREMSAQWSARESGIDLRYVGDGWRLYTRTRYAPYVERMLLDGARSKLTRAALETLAVIAYRQPVTRARVSAVRGVNVDGVIRTLVARGLIAEAGTDVDTNGTLYVTTELFLERIGLASLTELPSLAPLLPDVDLIDEINDSLESDPRYTKLKKPAESDIDLGAEN